MLFSSCDQLMRRFRPSHTCTHCSLSATHAAVSPASEMLWKLLGTLSENSLWLSHIASGWNAKDCTCFVRTEFPWERERQVETYLFFISVRVQVVCAKTKAWKHINCGVCYLVMFIVLTIRCYLKRCFSTSDPECVVKEKNLGAVYTILFSTKIWNLSN